MPKKKGKGKGKGKGKKDVKKGPDPAEMAEIFRKNYRKVCQEIGLPGVDEFVMQSFGGEEGPPRVLTLASPLGDAGVQALTKALQGKNQDGLEGPYLILQSLRLWNCDVGPYGAECVANMIAEAGEDSELQMIELMGNRIGIEGAFKIGDAFADGGNVKVSHLWISMDNSFKDVGVANLCSGLRTSAIRSLKLEFVGLTIDATHDLCKLFTGSKSMLRELSLKGNQLKDEGIEALCTLQDQSLKKSKTLQKLDISDNMCGYHPGALNALVEVLRGNENLKEVNYSGHEIGVEGAKILLEVVNKENKNLDSFKITSGIPSELMDKLMECGGGGKKKKGKKGKGKKGKGKKKK